MPSSGAPMRAAAQQNGERSKGNGTHAERTTARKTGANTNWSSTSFFACDGAGLVSHR
jgi:hypothetical protein